MSGFGCQFLPVRSQVKRVSDRHASSLRCYRPPHCRPKDGNRLSDSPLLAFYLGQRIKFFRSDEKIFDQIESLKKIGIERRDRFAAGLVFIDRAINPQKKRNIEIALFMFIVCGAEGESRTRTGMRPLDPEPKFKLLFFTHT